MRAAVRSWGVRLAWIAVVLGGAMHAWAYRAYQPDDAFIFLVYAKNLLAGHGLTFNGERVEGYSSVLWTVLVAGGGLSGLDLLLVAKAAGCLLYAATGLLLLRLLRSVDPTANALSRLCLAALWAALPPLALWSDGAMETLLHAFVLLLACGLYFNASMNARCANALAAGVGLGLLAWTRPEGFAYIALVPAFEISKLLLRRRVDFRATAITFIAALASLAVLLAWRRATYGAWLPVTVAAKTGDWTAQWQAGIAYLRGFGADYGWLLAADLLATAWLLRQGGLGGWWAWLSLVVVVGQTAFCVAVGGDWMLGYRFMVPVLSLMVLNVVLALSAHSRTLLAVTALGLLLATRVGLPMHHQAMQQARDGSGAVMMGQYLAALPLPPNQKIAVVDAGAIPYYTGWPTIDMVGLNNAHIAALPGGFMTKWDNAYVLAQRPDWIQLHTYLHEGAAYPTDDFHGAVLLYFSDEFHRWYRWDPGSPIANLYRRREQPLAGSFLTSFTSAQLQARHDRASQRLLVHLRKTGEGRWPRTRDGQLHNATVYVRVRALGHEGAITAEHYQPIPHFMRQGDEASFEWEWRNAGDVQVCAVLLGVIDFPGCQTLRVD